MSVPDRDHLDEELTLEIEEEPSQDIEMLNANDAPLSVNTAEVPDITETDDEYNDQVMQETDGDQYTHNHQAFATVLASMNQRVRIDYDDFEDDPNDIYKPEGVIHLDIDCFTDFCRGQPDHQQRLSKPVFVRGLPWRILAIPRESQPRTVNSRTHRALGFFLQCNGDSDQLAWNCVATATLRVLSQKEGVDDHSRRISHAFYPKENDWGYSQFLTCDQLANPESGYVKDDTIKLVVHVCADAPHGVSWDSKKHAGHIGLKNQGATCYMNSILQTLFFTNKLRKAVYEMPTINDEADNNVALAMQRVFYDLQHSDRPVGTKKLTKSFGWDSLETFMQHDVQELCRVLLDNLETKMKGVAAIEDTIPSLFKGKMTSFVKCTEVDFESSREEAFYDIQLNVKGKNNIIESFREYTQAERLDGDNKYDAGEFGLQVAEIGKKFITFPPVLHLQLMRFQYEPNQDAMVKINDRFEFPDRLNLNEFTVNGADENGEDYVYRLHAVLVHSGDFHGGHYVVFINTNLPDSKSKPRWCKFDDDVVSRASQRDAISANFGGDDAETPNRTYTNAYMLVYVRQKCINGVLAPITDEDIPKHLRIRFEKERAEENKKKKEKSEAHLYTEVVFVTESDIFRHHGFDLIDPRLIEDDLPKERVLKSHTVNDLYELSCKLLCKQAEKEDDQKEQNKINVNKIRLWRFDEQPYRNEHGHSPMSLARLRPNHYMPFKDGIDNRKLEQALDGERSLIYIEGPNEFLPHYEESVDMLMFLKFYNARNQSVSTIGHIIMNPNLNLASYLNVCRQMAGLDAQAPLRFYEEVSPDKVRPVDNFECSLTHDYVLLEINDGGILIFEDASEAVDINNAKYHFHRIYNTIDVEICMNGDNFLSVNADPELPVIGQVALDWHCNQLTAYIGKAIGYDSEKILLWRMQAYHDRPNTFLPYDAYGTAKVKDLLNLIGANTHDPRRGKRYRLFYTKLPIRITEMDKRKQMKVQMMDEKMNIQEITIFPEKSGTVANVLEEARREFKFAPEGSGKLRLVYVGTNPHTTRVFQIFQETTAVLEIAQKQFTPSYMALRVEEIPLDQVNINPNYEYLLPVAHFDRDPSRLFGVPFYVKVRQDEPFTSVRDRIQRTMDVSDAEFAKYRFALVMSSRITRYLDLDSTTARVNLAELGHTHVTTANSHPYLGIDHLNKSRGQRSHTAEKAIVIHN